MNICSAIANLLTLEGRRKKRTWVHDEDGL